MFLFPKKSCSYRPQPGIKSSSCARDGKGPVNIMQFIGRRLQETFCRLKGGIFAGGLQDPGIDQVGKDGIKVKPELMAVPDPAADGIQLQAIVNGLEEEIAAVKKLFPVIIQKPVGNGKGS